MTPSLRPVLVGLTMFAAALSGVLAQQVPDPDARQPRIVDTKLDEAERIERRAEWFYSSRRAGTTAQGSAAPRCRP